MTKLQACQLTLARMLERSRKSLVTKSFDRSDPRRAAGGINRRNQADGDCRRSDPEPIHPTRVERDVRKRVDLLIKRQPAVPVSEITQTIAHHQPDRRALGGWAL